VSVQRYDFASILDVLLYSLRTHIAAPFAYFYRTLYLLLYKSLITFQQEELQHKPCRQSAD